MTIQTTTKINHIVPNNNDELINNQTSYQSTISSTSLSTIIYVTDSNIRVEPAESIVNMEGNKGDAPENTVSFYDTYPLFFFNSNTINIPQNVKRHIERQIPKKYLNRIDRNTKFAVEKCLVFTANLTSTIFSDNRWKPLSSTILHNQFKKGNDNTFLYPHVVEALKYSSDSTDSVIQVKKNEFGKETYQEGKTSKLYAFTDLYYNNNLVKYTVKNPEIIAKRNKFIYDQIVKATDNGIASNLLRLYSRIDLPTLLELNIEANRLIKNNHRSRKGKLLTKLNKHTKKYFKDASKRSFVEDNIKSFKFYTEISFMVPKIGNYKSGGRVVDSFVLMHSWIRKLIKIDGEPTVEIDFKAFHPNIAMSIYGGSTKYLTHQLVAQESAIDLKDVKIQHLSFFNETLMGMKRSPLYQYYKESEPEMLKKIEYEKLNSQYIHKITSMRMFAKEVEIMTEIIKRLNEMDIYVGYVYDALFCKQSVAGKVKEIMNEVVLEFGVHTIAM